MLFHSAISDAENSEDALAQIVDQTLDATGGVVDVAFLFFTPHHHEHIERVVEKLWLELDPQAVIGCSAEGVIGGDREIEREPGISLLAGSLGDADARVHPFHIAADDWREMISEDGRDALLERIGAGEETRGVIALGDPFTTPLAQFLGAFDAAAPRVPLVGGMSSAARSPGNNLLLRNDDLFDDGLVGISVSGGGLRVETLVSQGCRPIGKPVVVTKSQGSVVEQLGGKPALQVLREVVDEMTPAEQALLRKGLFIGQAMSEYRDHFSRGDFLVRNVLRLDEDTGTIEAAEYIRPGRTVQFHVRDSDTAHEDLTTLLDAHRADFHDAAAAGTLLFSCNGRGTRMFDDVCHDVRAVRAAMPKTPVAGFFAAGEFGPVGGKNFIHGHTASLAMFRAE